MRKIDLFFNLKWAGAFFRQFRMSFLFILLIMYSACNTWDLELQSIPEVDTRGFEANQNPSKGKVYGEIKGLLEDDFVNNYGHVWSLANHPPPSVENNIGQSLSGKKGNGSFQSELNELTPGKTYFYRAYIIYGEEIIYGKETLSFATEPLSPVFTIDSISNQPGEFKIKVFTTISNLPIGISLDFFGITWGKDNLPEITSAPVVSEQGILLFEPFFQFETEILLPQEDVFLRPFLVATEIPYYGNSFYYQHHNVWIQRADFGGGKRYSAIGFSIGQKGYICMGKDGDQDPTKDFWEYDPLTDNWTQKADFGGGKRYSPIGFSIEQKGYIGMGSDTLFQKKSDFWEYDPLTDSWAQKANFGGVGRGGAIAFSIGQKGYVGTGWNGGYTQDFWEYNPQTNTWARRADFGGGRRSSAVGFSIGQKGYVGTGAGSIGTSKTFWEYDPLTDTWTQKTDFGGLNRSASFGFSIGQKGYIGGGNLGDGSQINAAEDFWEYTPE